MPSIIYHRKLKHNDKFLFLTLLVVLYVYCILRAILKKSISTAIDCQGSHPIPPSLPNIIYISEMQLKSLFKHNISLQTQDTSTFMKMISVIVPVFNVENYLSVCLQSILCQTYRSLDIIIIDDCSTDSSGKIADNYARKDSRIIVYHLERNHGLFNARKLGTLLCASRYCCYLDGDDYLTSSHSIELMVEHIEHHHVDILHFSIAVQSDIENTASTKSIISWCKPYNQHLRHDAILKACYLEKKFGWTMWNKVYNASICKRAYSLLQCNLTFGEDVVAFFGITFFAKSYLGIHTQPIYTYRIGSGVSTKNTQALTQFLEFLRSEMEVLRCIENFLTINNVNSQKYRGIVDMIKKRLLSNQLSRLRVLSMEDWPTAKTALSEAYGYEVISEFHPSHREVC